MKTFLPALLAAALVSVAFAEVQPAALKFSLNTEPYVVPEGKVFIVEHLLASGPDVTIQIYISYTLPFLNHATVGPGNILLPGRANKDELFTLKLPFRFPAGATIRRPLAGLNENYTMLGILVDKEELFATVPSEIQGTNATGGAPSALASSTSARPSKLSIEQSPDLQHWTPATDGVEKISKTEASVAFDGSTPQRFIRAVAKVKPQDTYLDEEE